MAPTLCHINMAEGTPNLEISSSHGRVHTLESGHGEAAVRALPEEDTARLGLQHHSQPWDAARGSIRALAVRKQTDSRNLGFEGSQSFAEFRGY